ncbi:MAG: hypothetical protein IT262_02565 [Saprospiraceae bacterium]|nr:hypothetical protein [Saprospiraceae bacterium]
MRYLIVLLLFAQCSKHTADHRTAQTDTVYPPWYTPPDLRTHYQTMDINSDGVLDSIDVGSSGGSGFGSASGTIINGKTGEKFTIESESCFCAFRTIVEIPPALLLPENQAFKSKMEAEMLPRKAASPDPSLQWILQGLQQKHDLTGRKYFDIYVNKGIDWQPLPILLPEDYFLEILENKPPLPGHYYLTYAGSNHYLNVKTDTLQQRYRDEDIVLWATAHGIVLQKADRYAWVFVTDIELTGGPDKLRWASIGYFKKVGNILIVNHLRPTSSEGKVFVIDLETGKCAGLSTEMSTEISAMLGPPEQQIADHPLIREMMEEFKTLYK